MIGRLTLTLLAAAASPPPGDLAPIHGPYAPTIDPANFVRTIDNRYLPYTPGMRIHFKGVRGTTPQTDDQVVLKRTMHDPRRDVHGRPRHRLRARARGRAHG